MCTSSISAQWNKELGEYRSKIDVVNIGVLYGHLQNESRDFYIKRYGSEEEVISGECKCHENSVGNKEIVEIIEKLNRFDSKINLIIVNKLNSQYENINTDKRLYVLRKDSEGKYSIKKICGSEGEKGFLIIEKNFNENA